MDNKTIFRIIDQFKGTFSVAGWNIFCSAYEYICYPDLYKKNRQENISSVKEYLDMQVKIKGMKL